VSKNYSIANFSTGKNNTMNPMTTMQLDISAARDNISKVDRMREKFDAESDEHKQVCIRYLHHNTPFDPISYLINIARNAMQRK
jgi:hypothetical protein